METIYRLASGSGPGSNAIEQYAKETICKGHLTSEISSTVKSIIKEVFSTIGSEISTPSTSHDVKPLSRTISSQHILCETSSPAVSDLCHLLEAALLHGLKEKLSLSKMTAAVLGPRSPQKQSLNPTATSSDTYSQDFWPIIQILCHNQVSESIMRLTNVYTDIGRCRAWLRITLNEGLFGSYMEALSSDTSLLHGFYRSSAYVRDKDHMDSLKSIMKSIDSLTFQLNYDSSNLNTWSPFTLKMIGIQVKADPIPVMPAVDALDEVRRMEKSSTPTSSSSRKKNNLHLKRNTGGRMQTSSLQSKLEAQNSHSESGSTDYLSSLTNLSIRSDEDKMDTDELNASRSRDNSSSEVIAPSPQVSAMPNINITTVSGEEKTIETATPPINISMTSTSKNRGLNADSIAGGNSISRRTGWSSSPPSSTTERHNAQQLPQQDYSSMYSHYIESTEVVLSSTPDLKDLQFGSSPSARRSIPRASLPTGRQKPSPQFTIFAAKKRSARETKDREVVSFAAGGNFEVIPKSIVLNNEESETQEFLLQLNRIGREVGLDEQDYKCNSCGRPIGMIYGKFRTCRFDGYNYCLDCHANEEAQIPSRIIYNWDFRKYPVAKKNKKLLDVTETDPLLDIKITSPSLYSAIPELALTLDLRTQLFFLHAYIFTCQESIAQALRKLVWPKEHLFEHVHLYSVADLVQVNSGALQNQIKKAVLFARNHVISCVLCSQKGFICELCKNPNIIYPFDTGTTFRCDSCKAVFHRSCCTAAEKPFSCPRCLRIQRRKIAVESNDTFE